ncbi:MAG: hypothetical protein LUQ38_09975 [Methanotrichaceae archaeon]|nr:hypothetical protein [Methanotrichaceae archaeon]
MGNQLKVDWSREGDKIDFVPALKRYRRYLIDMGFSSQTIDSYLFRAGK